MPKFECVRVTLSEVLEVRGDHVGLTEPEIWSVLCQAVMALQDVYVTEAKLDDNTRKECRNVILDLNGCQVNSDESKNHEKGEQLSRISVDIRCDNVILESTDERNVRQNPDGSDASVNSTLTDVASDTIEPEVQRESDLITAKLERLRGPEYVIRSCYSSVRLHLNPKRDSVVNVCPTPRMVTVVSLTGQRYEVEINCDTTNGEIFHAVAKCEKLAEKFLFGLTHLHGGEFLFLDLDCNFFDTTASNGQFGGHRSSADSCTLYLRMKFYVKSDIIRYSTTKQMHYLQLRKDILEERISCNLQSALLLASLALQVEYDREDDAVNEFNLEHYVPHWVLQKPNVESIRKELIRLHRLSEVTTPDLARGNYLNEVQSLRDYGFHFHVVHRDKRDSKSAILLGVSLAGISIFAPLNTKDGENKQELQRYLWPNITRITHDKRHFVLTLQSRNLKNHFMKCRFHTRDYFGKYLFNLAFTHHRLHLRLASQFDNSEIDSFGVCNGENAFLISMTGDVLLPKGGVLPVQESNILCPTNLTKARRSRSLKDLTLMKWRKRTPKISLASDDNGQSQQNASKFGPRLLAGFFKKQNVQMDNGVDQTVNVTISQPYVIGTSFRLQQSASPVIDCDETISQSLAERFANVTGVESTERRISLVTLVRDEHGRLGITVCEGADGGTYVQSIDPRHYAAGIRPGDRLMSISGKHIEVESYETVVELLRNSTTVDLVVAQNVDHLDDDVFEPDCNATQSVAFDVTPAPMTAATKANEDRKKIGGSSDVTYECHDADLRNEITCFIHERANTRFEDSAATTNNSEAAAAVTTAGSLSKQNDVFTINGSRETLDGALEVLLESHLLTGTAAVEDHLVERSGSSPLPHSAVDQNVDITWKRRQFDFGEFSEPSFHPALAASATEVDGKREYSCNESLADDIMVTKQDQSSEDTAEFNMQQRNMSSSAGDGMVSLDSVESTGCPVKTVLWSPRHSGTVLNKICNFEVQTIQSGCQTQKPMLDLSQKGLMNKGPLPKCSSLHRLTSEEYADHFEKRQAGEWCSAVKSKLYRPKNLPQLARSKTMPAVYKDHVASTAPDTPDADSSEPSSPSKFLYLSQLKHHNAPWWSKHSLADDRDDDVSPKKPVSPVNTQISQQKMTENLARASSLLNLVSPLNKKQEVVHANTSNSSQMLRTFKPRQLSLSTEHIGASTSLVSIAKEKLRKHSTVAEMLPIIAKPVSTNSPSPLSFRPRECPKMMSKQGDPSMSVLSDEKMRQLQARFPFIKESMVFEVSITKNSRGLGLSICGGRDQDPDDPLMLLIRIKRLYNLHPASDCGRLEVGDVLLKVNGRHVTGLNQSEVVDALRVTSVAADLVVCRPPPGTLPPVPQTGGLANSSALSLSSLNLLGLASSSSAHADSPIPKEFEITMEKWYGSLGFTLHKVDGPQPGHYIKALVKDPALTDGRIRPGDQILQVNGTDISRMSHDETISLLRSALSTVTLLVSRGMEPPPSPLSPIAACFPFESEDNHFRKDKKVLRKEAQDLLFDKERRRSQESGCGSSVSPTNRRHRRKEKTHSNTTESSKSDTYSSASDVDSLGATPIPPHDTLCVSDINLPMKKQPTSPLSLARGSAEDLSTATRLKSLNLDVCSNDTFPIPKSVPSLQISKHMESDQLSSMDEECPDSFKRRVSPSKTDSSGRNSSKTDNNSVQNASPPLGLMKWRGAFLSPEFKSRDDPKPCVVDQVFPMSITVDLDRSWNTRLGFSLLNVDNGNLKGTYVRTIHPGSLAEKDGRLKPGDGLLKVNGQLVKGLATDSVIELLRSIRGKVILDVVRDPVVSNKVLAKAHTTRSPSQVNMKAFWKEWATKIFE